MIRGTIRGGRRENITADLRLHNRFDLELRGKDGRLKKRARAYNVILNNYWAVLFSGSAVDYYIAYGSGTGTPDVTDTALFTQEGRKQVSGYSYDDAHYTEGWNSRTCSITLGETEANGVTIREVGLSSYLSGITTHALLQDMDGNPISVEKTSEDILTIKSTVFIHWEVGGYGGGKIRYVPASHWFGERPSVSSVDVSKGLLGGNMSTVSVSHTASGDAAQKTWTIGPIHVGPGSLNVNSFRSFMVFAGMVFDMSRTAQSASGPYQVTGEAIGTGDGVTTDWRTAFEMPLSGTVYVDGAASAGVISPKTRGAEISIYFEGLDPQSTDAIHVPRGAVLLAQGNNIKNADSYYYNPFWEAGMGVASIYKGASSQRVYVSNDFVSWIELGAGNNGLINVPEQHRLKKYWRVYANFTGYNTYPLYFNGTSNYGNNVHFDTAPAEGAVITADYTTPFVPKDADHVWDVTVTLRLAAYSGQG